MHLGTIDFISLRDGLRSISNGVQDGSDGLQGNCDEIQDSFGGPRGSLVSFRTVFFFHEFQDVLMGSSG